MAERSATESRPQAASPLDPGDRLAPHQAAALLIAPLAWLAFFTLGWILPPVACDTGFTASVQLAAAATLVVAAAGLAVAIGILRRLARGGADRGGAPWFLAEFAVLLSGLLVLGPVIAWSFMLAVGVCQ